MSEGKRGGRVSRLTVSFWEGGSPQLCVFTPKDRKPVLRGDFAREVRDVVRQLCRSPDREILAGPVRPDHVPLLLRVPPHLAPSRVRQVIKGKTSQALVSDQRKLRQEFW